MKKSISIRFGLAFMTAALCCGLGALPAPVRAQTLGQQVAPQPLDGQAPGSNPAGAFRTMDSYGQQQLPQQGLPLTLPGTTPMNGTRGDVFGTGADIPQASPNAQVSEGDLLDIVIFNTPELSGRFRVNASGDILLTLAGPLHVSGMTVSEITDAVTKRYKDTGLLVNPQVNVFVAEYTHRTITITGEVRSPGLYSISAPRTLLDTLAMAGGLNETASRTISIVHAADPKNIIHVTLNVGAQTPESIEQTRMKILPGDLIFIARSGIVYVVGELARPGAYQVEHNNRLTLLEAIALAGGPTKIAKMGEARLIRRSPTGREEIHVDLRKVLYGNGPDMLLTDGDILFVPTSLKREYAFSALDASIGAATGYAIFRLSSF